MTGYRGSADRRGCTGSNIPGIVRNSDLRKGWIREPWCSGTEQSRCRLLQADRRMSRCKRRGTDLERRMFAWFAFRLPSHNCGTGAVILLQQNRNNLWYKEYSFPWSDLFGRRFAQTDYRLKELFHKC